MSNRSIARTACPTLLIVLFASFAFAQYPAPSVDQTTINQLVADTNGAAKVKIHTATGGARLVNIPASKQGDLAPKAARSLTAPGKVNAFFKQYARMFGMRNPDTELKQVGQMKGRIGDTMLVYNQTYAGLPVFGGVLKAHLDGQNRLRAVNGTFIPDIAVSPTAARTAAEVAASAVSKVNAEKGSSTPATARRTTLMVYQNGLAKGVNLGVHLVWEVLVTNGRDVREFVYMDAQNGKFVDQITGAPDGMFRRAYDGNNEPNVPATYPDTPFWVEGDAFPTGNNEADNMITSSKETYDFYFKSFGRDSFDGAGAKMDSIFDRGYSCPNASWNGTFISFCPGFTADDVTAHEWSHAYTEFTDGLIYQWQPGALNEAYSDIWGETVDRLNGRDVNPYPDAQRVTGVCSKYSPPRVTCHVNTPTAIAGDNAAQAAQFGPSLDQTGPVTGDISYVAPFDGCTAYPAGSQTGKIALIDRGTCTFVVKVKNAQVAGAIGVVVANNVDTGLPGMGGNDSTITIPSLGITKADGNKIKQNLPSNVTLQALTATTTDSARWLMGEDIIPSGALRDMYNPGCYSNPAKVTDTAFYECSVNDAGGVHTNSGVINHAYALLVDGGSYNGQTIGPIGFTRAAHIYFRAQTLYQDPATDFVAHADALELACSDLIGQSLTDLKTGAASAETISSDTCTQVSKAIAAVEMRTLPTQCHFGTLMAPGQPNRCAVNKSPVDVFKDDFETDPSSSWTTTSATIPGWTVPGWTWTDDLPWAKGGKAMFARDIDHGCNENQTSLQRLISPAITIPAGSAKPYLSFQHAFGMEPGFDGGALRVRVNGGDWQYVQARDIYFNTYSGTLLTAAQGNTNPYAGLDTYTGSDPGQVIGKWAWSYVDLGRYLPATAGSQAYTVQLRWDVGTDFCTGQIGWYVDDVELFTCSPNRGNGK